MNSVERHELRYQRRKAKRVQKRLEFENSLGAYEDIFSFENLYDAFYLCRRGVRWKASIQNYERRLPSNSYKLYEELANETWVSKGFTKFYISERGKLRKIQSVHISERCIQRVFCDKYLVPLLSRSIIYDNGASMQGKGIDFALNRLKKHLNDNYKLTHSNDGYILLFDFSNYFGNISHEVLYKIIDPIISNPKLRRLFHQLIDAFDEGVGLGSQVSQISAIYFANEIDHTFKDKMGIKGYARYMDDGYIISNNLSVIKRCKEVLIDLCSKLYITMNDKKIRVCKISKGFIFLKKRFLLKPNGKLIIRLPKQSYKSEKRRLHRMYEKGLPYSISNKSYRSWRGNASKYNGFNKSVKSVDDCFNKLWIEPFICGEVRRIS